MEDSKRMRVLYVVDYLPNAANSVGEIFSNILQAPKLSNTTTVAACRHGMDTACMRKKISEGITAYSSDCSELQSTLCNPDLSFFSKLDCVIWKVLYGLLSKVGQRESLKRYTRKVNLKRLTKTEKPQIVVFLLFSPDNSFADICDKAKIPYIYILYDTFVTRPNVEEADREIEKRVIQGSKRYFVPDFFEDDYRQAYSCDKITPYCLPLLIPQSKVLQAYKECQNIKYDFSYFGQIQAFRNGKEINALFKSMGCKLDIFTSDEETIREYKNDEFFALHPPVLGDEMSKAVAESRYLVAFDNSAPYANYLPSKAYLYASFTKPIIAFGDNDDSALIRFFKGNPLFYYHKLGTPVDGLLSFISQHKTSCFDESIYHLYEQYLPDKALIPVLKAIVDD